MPISRDHTLDQSDVLMSPTFSAGPIGPNGRVNINVGGVRFETFASTCQNVPESRLYYIIEKWAQTPEYDPDRGEYFFDRHPMFFPYILEYYRTGKLHCPTEVCGPLFEDELLFWGVDESVMEPCCYPNFRKHRDAETQLQSFDSVNGDKESDGQPPPSVEATPPYGHQQSPTIHREGSFSYRVKDMWEYWQPRIWRLFEEPNSSKVAQVTDLRYVIWLFNCLCGS